MSNVKKVWIVIFGSTEGGDVDITVHSTYDLARKSADMAAGDDYWEWETDFFGSDDFNYIEINEKIIDANR